MVVMTKEIFTTLGLHWLRQSPTVLEIVDRSCVKPEGVVEDIAITVVSWGYQTYFLMLKTKSNFVGHPLILGRPWLAIANAFIACGSSFMRISDGQPTKNLNLYRATKPSKDLENTLWDEFEPKSDYSHPPLTLGKAEKFKNEIENDIINGFISNPLVVTSIDDLGV